MDHPQPPPSLPAGRPVVLDARVRIRNGASVLLGGAPWGVLRIAPAGRSLVARLAAAGSGGLVPREAVERALADRLSARGVVHPVVTADRGRRVDFDVVIPAFEGPDLLARCLASLRDTAPTARVIVVDDASTDAGVARVARAYGAVLVRHSVNRGPAAARNTGIREATSPIVAFVDADCVAMPGWAEPLLAHFDDPRVVAVAPRIRSAANSRRLLARYCQTRGSLDMGRHPARVAPGAPVGYLPSATLLVRRSVLSEHPFDERLRLGEDVDLIWRLSDAGGIVRYEPSSTITHEMRPDVRRWATRIFDYGTSAAELDRRHPRRLAPARLSGWNLAIAAVLVARRPDWRIRTAAALGLAGAATAELAATLADRRIAPEVMCRRLTSDAGSAGHLLRREWWPIGALALMRAADSRWARAAAAAMLVPLVAEWLAERPRVDLPRYLLMRLAEDAAYGTGVITGAVRSRRPGVLLPQIRPPRRPRRPG